MRQILFRRTFQKCQRKIQKIFCAGDFCKKLNHLLSNASQAEISKYILCIIFQNITTLIPGFFDDFDFDGSDDISFGILEATNSNNSISQSNSECHTESVEDRTDFHSLINRINTNDSSPLKSPRPARFLEDKENQALAFNLDEEEIINTGIFGEAP